MHMAESQGFDSAAVEAQRGKRLLRRWLFGFFGIMFIANGFFLWFALSTHTGEQSRNAYEEGRTYNDTLAEAARLDALGWQMNASAANGGLRLALLDSASQPISARIVSARLFSYRDAKADRDLTLLAEGPGHYMADISGVGSGRWELQVRLASPEGPVELRRDVLVK